MEKEDVFVLEIEEEKKEPRGIPLDSPPIVWEVEPLSVEEIERLVLPNAHQSQI